MLPGSKSITNRALLLAALCDRPVTLRNALFSEDTDIMAEALRRLIRRSLRRQRRYGRTVSHRIMRRRPGRHLQS